MLQRILCAIMVVVGLLAHSNTFAAEEDNRLELPQKIEVEKGTSELQLPILLTNAVALAGFQFDLYLPEGFSVAKDEYDDYMMDVARTTPKRHSLATREMPDGALRIVLSSMTNATFSGNSGAVLNVTVKVGNNIATGSYNVNLKNIVLTDPQAKRYTSADVSGTIVVKEEQPVTITAQNITMVYGDEVPALTYTSAGAELKGIPSLSCEATSTSPVGTYPIVVSQGTVENKKVTYVNGTFAITKAPLSITAKSYSMKQGDTLPTFDVEYSGFKNNETKDVLTKQPSISCEATSATSPGKYDIIVDGAEAQNYEISYTNGTLTIIEADPVKVTAKSYTIVYGDAIPEFEFTSEGKALEGMPTIRCEATSTSPVGNYPIVISKGSVTNYNDSYVNGVLTITKAPLTIKAGIYSKKQYDPMPEFSVSYAGFKNNETKDVLEKQATVSCEANENSAPGEYAVTVSGAEAKNYRFQYLAGRLTVTEPDSYTLTYMVDGEVYQSFTIKYRDRIVPLKEPSKEGYTFSGWSEIPETMPAHDVDVMGTFTKNIFGKCVTPTISYANGEVTFNSETEGVTFIYDTDIEDEDVKGNIGDKVQFSVTYHISVYATKDGFENSDVATATLCWIDVDPWTEGITDEVAITEVKALPVLIQSQGNAISVQGLNAGTEVLVYSIDGKQQGSAIVINGTVCINTSLLPGSIAIVKIGNKTVKVQVK